MQRLFAALLAVALLGLGSAALGQPQSSGNGNATEDKIGTQVFEQLQKKGEILPRTSPWYPVLRPIAEQIKRIADPQYYRPFTFVLVHEDQPNAFAVPGGNIYVTDSLMKFVSSREELAGVLCHETSHDIHHDVVNNMAKDQRLQTRDTILGGLANILTGGRASGVTNLLLNVDLIAESNHFSREVETAADLKGADICAQAGSNPYGMIWLFEDFQKSGNGGAIEMLSDHPRDDHRVSDLLGHFRQNPALFGKFNPDRSLATKLAKPAGTESPAPAATFTDPPF